MGSAGVYSREEGDFDNVYFKTRRDYASGEWTDPLGYNNHDVSSGSRSHIEWLGTDRVMSYGMVYFAEDQGHLVPYFDLMTPRAFFWDDFESGNLSEW